jgi:hypothetical protein
MAGTYGYIDRPAGLVLCQVQRATKSCHVFATGAGLSLRKHPLRPVPTPYLQNRRAPSVIWKPGADPAVVDATEIEMIDLAGFGAPAAELSASDQVFMLVGGGLLIGILGFGAMLMSKEPREVDWVRD